jgi:hypothetical protein
MNDEGKLRLQRLQDYCLRRKVCVVGDKISPSAMRDALAKVGFEKSISYYSDILRGAANSFGPKVARDFELGLGMSMFFLDGGADWPFSTELYRRVEDLSEEEALHLENVMRAHLQMPAKQIKVSRKPG